MPRHPRQNLPLDLIALRRSSRGAGYAAPQPGGASAGMMPVINEQSLGPQAAPGSAEGDPTFALTAEQFRLLLQGIWRRGRLIVQPFLATNVAPLVLRPQEPRYYCFIQNQSLVNQLAVNFGRPAGFPGIVPVDGIIIPPNFGFYEPLMVPQDEISVTASGINTPGILIYSNLIS